VPDKSVEQNPGGPKPLVYVVDDEPLVLELSSTLLEPEGFEVMCFRDAESALEHFRAAERRPDLLISDYAMSESMNGLQLIAACQKLCPGLKCFLVSGTVDSSVFQNSETQPDEFLPKPFRPTQFVERVRKLLRIAD
jgi:DNA-binding NtrC family response regulator